MPTEITPLQVNAFEFDAQLNVAYDLLENTTANIFITGEAGTGKSTLLQYFREHTSKRIVVLAPTGVAAINVHGQTIHSFFRFRPDITIDSVAAIRLRKAQRKVYASLEAIVVDEISMVRSDLLDCMDAFLRQHGTDPEKPFGGIQMIFFGDLYQLPPVVTRLDSDLFKNVYASPYFFDANAFKQTQFKMVELKKIYRQKDQAFIHLLNSVRNKSATARDLAILNKRLQPNLNPKAHDLYVHLTTTNLLADQINQARLKELSTPLFYVQGEITGGFDMKAIPTHQMLALKQGAQAMLLNNDPQGRWVNGTIGRIVSTKEDFETTKIIRVELPQIGIVEVTRFTWEMFRFVYNKKIERIDTQSAGSFHQYPMKLAWAITIHKSQGKTFSKVILDIGEGAFAPGQVYVALSRCTELEGLVLKKPITQRHILLDPRILRFLREIDSSGNPAIKEVAM